MASWDNIVRLKDLRAGIEEGDQNLRKMLRRYPVMMTTEDLHCCFENSRQLDDFKTRLNRAIEVFEANVPTLWDRIQEDDDPEVAGRQWRETALERLPPIPWYQGLRAWHVLMPLLSVACVVAVYFAVHNHDQIGTLEHLGLGLLLGGTFLYSVLGEPRGV